jgi:hypothetical protein
LIKNTHFIINIINSTMTNTKQLNTCTTMQKKVWMITYFFFKKMAFF